jgi:hypothetical protein
MDILKPRINTPESAGSAEAGHTYHKKRLIWKIVVIIILVLAAWQILSFFGLAPLAADFPMVSSADWQAVFLTNNQVYFGHLENYNNSYAILKDIYYLRVAEPLQQGAQPPGPTLNLVKLGAELHGPQDTMYVPKDKIMFWENLKKDSQVVQAINNFLATQPKK